MWYVTITNQITNQIGQSAKKVLVSEQQLPLFLNTVKAATLAFEWVKVWEPPHEPEKKTTVPLIPLSQE